MDLELTGQCPRRKLPSFSSVSPQGTLVPGFFSLYPYQRRLEFLASSIPLEEHGVHP